MSDQISTKKIGVWRIYQIIIQIYFDAHEMAEWISKYIWTEEKLWIQIQTKLVAHFMWMVKYLFSSLQCSMLNLQYLMFNVQCSMFNVQFTIRDILNDLISYIIHNPLSRERTLKRDSSKKYGFFDQIFQSNYSIWNFSLVHPGLTQESGRERWRRFSLYLGGFVPGLAIKKWIQEFLRTISREREDGGNVCHSNGGMWEWEVL